MSLAEILREEGRHEGWRKGLLEGKQEGQREANLNTARRMLAKGRDPLLIAESTELPLAEIRRLQSMLETLE